MRDKQVAVQRLVLIGLVLGITAVFTAMIWRFLVTLLLAAILTGLAGPVYRKFLGLWRGRKAAASATTLIFLLAVVGLPLLGFLAVVVSEGVHVTQKVSPWVQRTLEDPAGIPALLDRVPFAAQLEPYHGTLIAKAGELVERLGSIIVQSLTEATRVTFAFFFNLVILLYSMFFFLMGGSALLDRILYYVPLRREDELRMVDRFVSVTRATLKGTLIIGAIQGTLGGIGFAVAGLDAPVFWGTVMGLFSLIPGIGTGLVWVPACVILGLSDRTVAAVVLAVYFAAIVGSVDNILRPRLVGKDTQMPDLLVLLGTLGGIFLFGAIGFIIGPIVAALFVTVWDMYGAAFRDILPGGGDPAPEPPA